ncbi:MAG: hybrid sensor histidine kinase/response regulator [Oligoflexia bacterium]|nr:hybrid sensor histidine kinase/response regulator [Oligoflexia bacterium]
MKDRKDRKDRDDDKLKKIIIIDDLKSIHDDFKSIFEDNNTDIPSRMKELEKEIFGNYNKEITNHFKFIVDSAYQGEDGYNKVLQAQQEGNPYNLAFVDMRMPPGWDGLETIEKIMEIDSDIQIVICTAYSDYSVEDIEKRIGITDRVLIIKKPFDKVEIILMAKSLCEKWFLIQKARMKIGEMEKEIKGRAAEIEKIQKELFMSSKAASIGTLAAGMAHELNNPITIAFGHAMEVEKGFKKLAIENDSIQKSIGGMKQALERMIYIIKDLLTFLNTSAKNDYSALNICELIDSTISIFNEKTINKDIEIVKIFNEHELMVEGNLVQLKEVFLHLFFNARDALEGNSSKTKKISVTLMQEGDWINVWVEDNGKKIEEKDRERIFDPFFTTKDVGKGKGLGLSIAKNILKDHGGFINLQNENDHKKFLIKIPIKKVTK